MLSSPPQPQPHPPFIKKIIQLAENVNENTYFFYLCLSVSVVIGLHRVALSSWFSLELACFFMHHITHQSFPPVFSLLMYLSVCTFPSPLIIMFSVLFSVSKLFVPFSVSFLSLLGPCVEGGQRRLSTLCG